MDEAIYLVLVGLQLDWHCEEAKLNAHLSDSEKAHLSDLISRRIHERIPTAYLVGEAWFCGVAFKVNEDVLIPRSPIGELIQNHFEPWLPKEPESILDMCTGSGCIGIACGLEFPNTSIDLADISPEALLVAEENIARHNLSKKAHTYTSDLFNEIPKENRYDLIVSNPPYVDKEDYDEMPTEFHHEPSLGLVSGLDGLDACRRILRDSLSYLNDQGILIVEVGNSAGALQDAYPEVDFIWLEFEHGGHGVFLLSKEQLKLHSHRF